MKKQLLILSIILFGLQSLYSRPMKTSSPDLQSHEDTLNCSENLSEGDLTKDKEIEEQAKKDILDRAFEENFAPENNDQSTSSNTQLNDLLGVEVSDSEEESSLIFHDFDGNEGLIQKASELLKKHCTKDNVNWIITQVAENKEQIKTLAALVGITIPELIFKVLPGQKQ